jgi:DNA-binding transcriptional ArsR family regulator
VPDEQDDEQGDDRDIQKILAALGSPIRREILALIWDGDLPAGEIAAAFQVSAPTISQHLNVLREAGLVTRVSEGTFRRYHARHDVLRGLHGALDSDSAKWTPADDLPERALAAGWTGRVVVASVDLDVDRATAFAAFTDPVIYGRWLGVPVSIDDGRFSCTMEFGTRVRGHYDVVSPPDLIALRWDFEDDNVPVPGREMTGYVRFHPLTASDASTSGPSRSRVEVHQLVESAAQAEFMQVAWTMVLGRCRSGVVAASNPAASVKPRGSRPKRRRTA